MVNILKKILEEQSGERGNISLSQLPLPHLLPGVVEAAAEIIKRLNNGDRLLIVGDYDCDGIMATTTIFDFFQKLGYGEQVGYIVPDRFIDGYGVSNNMIDYASDNLYNFIVTVDNGIGAYHPVEYAKSKGISVIITDHHTPGELIPNADIIVNPKYELGDFPFMEISGATVAWYLCSQINKDLNAGIDMRQWMDLVGITVVSDVMPLHHLNVPLVKYALNQIKSGKRFIFELVFDSLKRQTLTETDIGFGFVPMINAVGRLDHAKNAIEVLLSRDKTEIRKGYEYFIETNNKRKYLNEELLKKVLPEAEAQAEKGAKVIIVKHNDLHEGIVGILAGRLAEKFMRPAYVFGWNEKKQIWKGSGRTSGIIQLYDLTCAGSKHALGFGGHAGAVGVAIEKDNFRKWFNSISKESKKFNDEDFVPVGSLAIECSLGDMTEEVVELMNQYRPFGQGFPEPKFKTNVFLKTLNSYKDGLNWKCLIVDSMGNSKTSFFFHEKNVGKVDETTVDIIFSPMESVTTKGREIQIMATLSNTAN